MDSYNYLAIIVSAVTCFIVGFIWFMVLFRKPYTQALDKTKEQMDRGPSMMAASLMQLLGNLVLAFVLAWLINKLGYETVMESLKLGVLIWLGFVAAVLGPMHAYQAFSFKFFSITSGIILVYILLTGTILTLWK